MRFNKTTCSDYGMRIIHLLDGYEPNGDEEIDHNTFNYEGWEKSMGVHSVKYFDEKYGKIIRKTFPDAKFKFGGLSSVQSMRTVEMKTTITNKQVNDFIKSKVNSKSFNEFLVRAYGSYDGFYSFIPQTAELLVKCKVADWKLDIVLGYLLRLQFNTKAKLAYAYEGLHLHLCDEDTWYEFL